MENKMYQTEDIEVLLLQKEFQELLPEERAFILEHIQDEKEYTRMRNLLFQMIEMETDELPDGPDQRVKQNLDALFIDQNKSRPLWRSIPFWSISGIAAVLIIGFLFFQKSNPALENKMLADNHIVTQDTLKKASSNATKQETQSDEATQIPLVVPEAISEVVTSDVATEEEMASPPTSANAGTVSIANLENDDVMVVSPELKKESKKTPETAYDHSINDYTLNYPGGENALKTDSQKIVAENREEQNASLKDKFTESPQPNTRIIFKFNVSSDGNISSVTMVKGENVSDKQKKIWETALKKNLKKFNINQHSMEGEFYLPVILK